MVTYKRAGSVVASVPLAGGKWLNHAFYVRYYTDTSDCCCDFLCISACGCPIKKAKDYLRMEVTQAAGDTMRVGAVYFNGVDGRSDAQPWL